MEIFQSAKKAAKAAVDALTADEIEITQENLFAWLTDHLPELPDTDALDDYLELFEEHALDDEPDDNDESEDDE